MGYREEHQRGSDERKALPPVVRDFYEEEYSRGYADNPHAEQQGHAAPRDTFLGLACKVCRRRLREAAKTSRLRRFLNRVYALSRGGASRLAINEIYVFLHEVMLNKDFSQINETFRSADVDELQPSMVISFLMATIPVKASLSTDLRRDFVDRAYKSIKARWGRERAEEIRFYL